MTSRIGGDQTVRRMGQACPPSSIRDLVNLVGSQCLEPYFQDIAPDYPSFSVLITNKNRSQAAEDAIRWITGSIKTRQGTAVLDALGLLDGDKLRPQKSRYAKWILEQLEKKGPGQVLNRSELITGNRGVEYDPRFKLEPEWVVVILASLVYSGHVTLSVTGKKIDASNLEDLGKMAIDDLKDFKHIERPRELPLRALQSLFEILSLAPGLLNEANREDAVSQLQNTVDTILDSVVKTQRSIVEEQPIWGVSLLDEKRKDEFRDELDSLKTFLESLHAYNSVGSSRSQVLGERYRQAKAHLATLRRAQELIRLSSELQPLLSYLNAAEAMLPADDEWVESA